MSGQVTTVYDGFCKVEKRLVDKHELVRTTDAAAVLVCNTRTNNVIFITQDRFPMIRDDNPNGTVTEVVAGRFDRPVSLVDLLILEVYEEIGIQLNPRNLVILNDAQPLAPSPGILTERIGVAVCFVGFDESDGADKTYGVDGEKIKRVSVPVRQLDRMIYSDLKTWGLAQYLQRMLATLGRGDPEFDLARLKTELVG